MKKVILIAAGLSFATVGLAQKKNVTTAIQALNNGELDEAKKAIDEAVVNESTKNDPKAWMARGDIYLKIQEKNLLAGKGEFDEAIKSYLRSAELDPKFSRDEMNMRLFSGALLYYKTGRNAYEEKKYEEAFKALNYPVMINQMEGGKRFNGFPYQKQFDTIAADAAVIRAYAAYNLNNYDEAAAILTKYKSNPIVSDASLYMYLSDAYSRAKKYDEQIAVINEARKLYPANGDLRNQEINYYITTGKQAELIGKLEEAVAQDPKNATLLYNLANMYVGMAYPKDANGKDLPKPANYDEIIKKAEASYEKLIALDGSKPDYQYYAGVLYYNEATDFHNKMRAITNMAKRTPADDKKYDEYQKQRDAMFKKALPFFEKAYGQLDPNAASLNADDKFTYQSTLLALKEIYGKLDMTAKFEEVDKKYKAMK